jgi:heterodisulfide reductase subunit B
VNNALAAGNLNYKPGTIKVRHLLEMIINDVGLDKLKERTKRPLYGLNVAAYYGCLVARPDSVFDSSEQPTAMDDMIEALGAKATPFSLKTFCCGGHMTQISETTALEMIHKIVQNAADSGADAIVTICPMCQLNLDVYQGYAHDLFGTDFQMPILYFTQLIGLALGLKPKELGFGQEFVDAKPAIAKIQDVPPPKARPERRPKHALPMPIMPE